MKKYKIALLASLAFAAAGAAIAAVGPVGYIQEFTYYTDASHSAVSGHGATGCSGGIIFISGKVTQYKVIDSTEPCGLF